MRRTRATSLPFGCVLTPTHPLLTPLHLRPWVCLYLDHAPGFGKVCFTDLRDPFGIRPPETPCALATFRPLKAGQVSYFARCSLLVHALLLISPPLLCVEQFHVLRVVDVVLKNAPPAVYRAAPVDSRRYFALGALMLRYRSEFLVRATHVLPPIAPPRCCWLPRRSHVLRHLF